MLSLLLPGPRAAVRDTLTWGLCVALALQCWAQPVGTGQRTEALVPSDLGHVAGGRAAQEPERLSWSPGPWSTYPLGASSQLKGLLLAVVFTVFQLLQDLVQHHRPLFLRGLCGSPDGKRGEKKSRKGGEAEERDGERESGREGGGERDEQSRERKEGRQVERQKEPEKRRKGGETQRRRNERRRGRGERNTAVSLQPHSPWGCLSRPRNPPALWPPPPIVSGDRTPFQKGGRKAPSQQLRG